MAFQYPKWQNFYERAWATRAKFINECLERGMNGYQAIKELEKKERKYQISLSADGVVEWEKIEIPDNNILSPEIRVPMLRISSMGGKEMTVPFHSSFNFADLLVDVFESTGPFDSIVELGCGYGRNLFEIFYRGGLLDVPYYGGEFTASGVELATRLADATPGMNAKFFHFNHLEPKLDIDLGKRAFIFTCHSIEQVSQIPNEWFEVVSNAADHVRCVHLEPFGFQINISGLASQKHKEFMLEQGWNTNFVDVLKLASKEKIIDIDTAMLEVGLSIDPYNPGSLAIWHSDKKR